MGRTLKIVFFTFYYPPDLCAGSFRAVALVEAYKKKLKPGDELHVITTHPNRYAEHRVEAKDREQIGGVKIHRIRVPLHQNSMIGQSRSFYVFSMSAFKQCKQIQPDFIIGTTSRLMTGVLTSSVAKQLSAPYFIDLRDIFSETISDLFSRKNSILGAVTRRVFLWLEKRVLCNAVGVNVVSQGFPDYFEARGIDTKQWTFYPNGVDCEFIGLNSKADQRQPNQTTIFYAGNIGSGQGLETIIPDLAESLGAAFRFVVVGSGSTASLLKEHVKQRSLNNVELLPPVGRSELVGYYQNADVLFLHLNDVPAFRRVLPSKVFEYAAFGKPMVAGISGYSAKFLQDNVPYVQLFHPGDVKGGVDAVGRAMGMEVDINDINRFVEKYSRESIMKEMVAYLDKSMRKACQKK